MRDVTPDRASEVRLGGAYVQRRGDGHVTGELVVTVEGERSVLRAGDAVYVREGVSHGVRNESADSAEFVLLFGPAVGAGRGPQYTPRKG